MGSSTESKISVLSRSQFSVLTPEDAKRLAKGEAKIDEYLNLDEDFEGEDEKFSAKIESDLKKLSTPDLNMSFQNVSGEDTVDSDSNQDDDRSSTFSTPVKLRREVDSGNSSRSSFSTTDNLPISISSQTSEGSTTLHSRSKSGEFIHQNSTD